MHGDRVVSWGEFDAVTDRIAAGLQALGLKPNTLSTYVNALMQPGLIRQERVGTSLPCVVDMDGLPPGWPNIDAICRARFAGADATGFGAA